MHSQSRSTGTRSTIPWQGVRPRRLCATRQHVTALAKSLDRRAQHDTRARRAASPALLDTSSLHSRSRSAGARSKIPALCSIRQRVTALTKSLDWRAQSPGKAFGLADSARHTNTSLYSRSRSTGMRHTMPQQGTSRTLHDKPTTSLHSRSRSTGVRNMIPCQGVGTRELCWTRQRVTAHVKSLGRRAQHDTMARRVASRTLLNTPVRHCTREVARPASASRRPGKAIGLADSGGHANKSLHPRSRSAGVRIAIPWQGARPRGLCTARQHGTALAKIKIEIYIYIYR